jgi:hypothetical protein
MKISRIAKTMEEWGVESDEAENSTWFYCHLLVSIPVRNSEKYSTKQKVAASSYCHRHRHRHHRVNEIR